MAGLLTFAAAAAVLLLTVIPLGATRMYAWPWSLVYWFAFAAAAGALVARSLDRRTGLVLPSAGACVAVGASALVILLSALASPYRPVVLRWATPWFEGLMAFLLAYDLLHAEPAAAASRRAAAWRLFTGALGLIAIASIAEWITGLRTTDLTTILRGRNAYPLGHANYTAGLAVLMLPTFAVAALRHRGARRAVWGGAIVLALAMLFVSGSRGAMIAVALTAVLALVTSRLSRRTQLIATGAALVLGLGLAAANPRVRAMFHPTPADAAPNASNVQRAAMLQAGARIGAARPLLGWGPGATPLAFPRFRALVDGGAEDVLQLHSLPVQLWAEFGAAGIGCALLALALGWRDRRTDPLATLTLAGYAVFSLFDAQLDVPVFAVSVGLLAALVARAPGSANTRRSRALVAAATLLTVALVAAVGRPDPTPALNVEALSERVGRAQPARAITLLRRSLALNPDQEIAHFNLGWLLVVDAPAEAEQHFLAAARLVPDKGGVYFGLGLARLNQGRRDDAVRGFALEMLNDPAFALSPWWAASELSPLRASALEQRRRWAAELARTLPAGGWTARELRYTEALLDWLDDRAPASAVRDAADTPARRRFFAGLPSPDVLRRAGGVTLRHERAGYPVLMRNLDLPAPLDLWTVQETASRTGPLASIWPEKGEIPSRQLIALLDGGDSRKN